MSTLLAEIETYLKRAGVSPSYFGKVAVGNSELVKRLREADRIHENTRKKVRNYLDAQNARLNRERAD